MAVPAARRSKNPVLFVKDSALTRIINLLSCPGGWGRSELLIPHRWVDNPCSSLIFHKPPWGVLLCCLVMVPPLECFWEWFLCFLEAFLNYMDKYFYDWFLKLKQFTTGFILSSFLAIPWVYYWVHFLFSLYSSCLYIFACSFLPLNLLFCLYLFLFLPLIFFLLFQ